MASRTEATKPTGALKKILECCKGVKEADALRSRNVPGALYIGRISRDIKMNGDLQSFDSGTRASILSIVAENDRRIDAIAFIPNVGERKEIEELVVNSFEVLEADFARFEVQFGHWQNWVNAAVIAGLFGLVAGVAAVILADPPEWSLTGLALAVLGATFAVIMTNRRTTTINAGVRWALLTAPVITLIWGLALRVLDRGNSLGDTGLLAIVIAALVLLGVAVVVSRPALRATRQPGGGSAAFDQFGATWPTVVRTTQLVAGELVALQGRITVEASRQARNAQRWLTVFVFVGGAAALTSGAAGVTAANTSESSSGFDPVVLLAFLGGGFTALTTALNPGGRWEQSKTLAQTCESLAQEVEAVIRLDLDGLQQDGGRAKVEEVAKRFDAIIGVPERERLWDSSDPGNPGVNDPRRSAAT